MEVRKQSEVRTPPDQRREMALNQGGAEVHLITPLMLYGFGRDIDDHAATCSTDASRGRRKKGEVTQSPQIERFWELTSFCCFGVA